MTTRHVLSGLTLVFERVPLRVFNVGFGIYGSVFHGEPSIAGAWELDDESMLDTLSYGRLVVPPPVPEHLEELAAEIREVQESLPGLRWPALPSLVRPASGTELTAMQELVPVARWAAQLLGSWADTERRRVARPTLHEFGGDAARLLPPRWREDMAHETWG